MEGILKYGTTKIDYGCHDWVVDNELQMSSESIFEFLNVIISSICCEVKAIFQVCDVSESG